LTVSLKTAARGQQRPFRKVKSCLPGDEVLRYEVSEGESRSVEARVWLCLMLTGIACVEKRERRKKGAGLLVDRLESMKFL
jgi:hypothetical protein